MSKERNYELIKKKNNLLYEKLLAIKINQNISIIGCNDGFYTLKIDTLDFGDGLLHNQQNIQKEIEKQVEVVDFDLPVICWLGLGLGYEVLQIIRRKHVTTKLVMIEPRLDVLKFIFEYVDLVEFLSDDNVLLFGGTVDDIAQQINESDVGDSLMFVDLDRFQIYEASFASRIYQRDVIDEIKQLFDRVIKYRLSCTGNSPDDTLLGINHFFSNIKFILNSPIIKEMGDIYKGYPAICVAAGPSLDKNIHVLKEVQDQALIFCADAVWKRIKIEEIYPDAVTSLERDKGTYRLFFADEMGTMDSTCCLIAQSVVYPKTLIEYKGSSIICSKSEIPFEQQASNHLPQLNNYNSGLSCAHTSFAIAKALGCDPIVVVGQDLAYGEEGFSHAKGTYGDRKTKNDRIFDGMEHFFIMNIDRTGVVETNSTYDLFRRWFEEEVRKDPSHRYINATEGGAYIAGMEVMTLQQVAETYLKHGKRKVRLHDAIEQLEAPNMKESLQKALDYFNKELEQLYENQRLLNEVNADFAEIHSLETQLHENEVTSDMIQRIADRELNYINAKVDRLLSKPSALTTLIQVYTIEYARIIANNRSIKSVQQYKHIYMSLWKLIKAMINEVEKLIYEYTRGIEIIKNGSICDNIDTPLLGEMYEP